MKDHLAERHPVPDGMKPDTYQRNISARAFDVARYVLFFGIPTGVGQITSIRTLERQIARLKASVSGAARTGRRDGPSLCPAARLPLGPAGCRRTRRPHPRAPHQSGRSCVPKPPRPHPVGRAESPCRTRTPAARVEAVDLCPAPDTLTDIAVTLLYPVTTRPYRDLLQHVAPWSAARKREVIGIATQSRSRRDELLRNFRTGPYIFDIVMDIGAYRDLHRHRRCQQFRQAFTTALGYATPPAIARCRSCERVPRRTGIESSRAFSKLPEPGCHYLLPFATNSRFLFKMDFAQAEYICRQRSGVKGHFSYRQIAWNMKEKIGKLEPDWPICWKPRHPGSKTPSSAEPSPAFLHPQLMACFR